MSAIEGSPPSGGTFEATVHQVAELLTSTGIAHKVAWQRGEVDSANITLPGGVQIWFYSDGMEILRDKLDRRFEIEDFQSFEHMRESFNAVVRDVIGRDFLGQSTAAQEGIE